MIIRGNDGSTVMQRFPLFVEGDFRRSCQEMDCISDELIHSAFESRCSWWREIIELVDIRINWILGTFDQSQLYNELYVLYP